MQGYQGWVRWNMTAPAAHQRLSCHQSLVHLPAAQVDTEQLQSMTSACGSMTGNIKAKNKIRQLIFENPERVIVGN